MKDEECERENERPLTLYQRERHYESQKARDVSYGQKTIDRCSQTWIRSSVNILCVSSLENS